MNTIGFTIRYKKSQFMMSIGVMAAITVVAAGIGWLQDPILALLVVYALMSLWGIVFVVLMFILQGSIKRMVVQNGGVICVKCMYDLSMSKPVGICPECGCTYDIEQNINLWRSRYSWPYPEDQSDDSSEPQDGHAETTE